MSSKFDYSLKMFVINTAKAAIGARAKERYIPAMLPEKHAMYRKTM